MYRLFAKSHALAAWEQIEECDSAIDATEWMMAYAKAKEHHALELRADDSPKPLASWQREPVS